MKRWLWMQNKTKLSASSIYLMATESTEEHEKINTLQKLVSCSSVDSVAIISVFISLKEY